MTQPNGLFSMHKAAVSVHNQATAKAGRDLWRPSNQTSPSEQGQLEQADQHMSCQVFNISRMENPQ